MNVSKGALSRQNPPMPRRPPPKPAPGRPRTRDEPIDSRVVVMLTASQRTGLDEIAAERNVSLGVVVREAIDAYLAK